MRIGLAQVTTSEIKDLNLRRGTELISEAGKKGCDILVLPELFMAHIPNQVPREKVLEIAEPIEGPFVNQLRDQVDKEGVHVAVGLLERDPEENQLYNTAVLLSSDGSLLLKYRKTHLYDAFRFKESARFKPGLEMPAVAKTSLANLGLMICYELRFPEVTRHLALADAGVILAPSAWFAGPLKEEHMMTLVKARALENTVFIAVASQVGHAYSGRSMIADPMGLIIADGGEEEKLLICDIDLERIKRVRETLPSLANRRADLY